MSAIVYLATGDLTDEAKRDTLQVYGIERLTKFKPPEMIFNRSYASSMDNKSGRGTLISQHEVSSLEMLIDISGLALAREMISSLADYQLASFEPVGTLYFTDVRKFIMINESVTFETLSCDRKIKLSFKIKWQY